MQGKSFPQYLGIDKSILVDGFLIFPKICAAILEIMCLDLHSLIRNFIGHILDSQGFKIHVDNKDADQMARMYRLI